MNTIGLKRNQHGIYQCEKYSNLWIEKKGTKWVILNENLLHCDRPVFTGKSLNQCIKWINRE